MTPPEPAPRRRRRWSLVAGLVLAITAAGVVVVGAGMDGFWITSASMEPTLQVGDRILVDRSPGQIHPGDIIVVSVPGSGGDVRLAKRVVGVPGDVLESRGGRLWRNGTPVEEPYAHGGLDLPRSTTVAAGTAYVLGDNRDDSRDSRVFGPVRLDAVHGRAVGRFWPPGRIGRLGNPVRGA